MVNTRGERNYSYSTVQKEEEEYKEGRLMKCGPTKHEDYNNCQVEGKFGNPQFINGDRGWEDYQCEKHTKHPGGRSHCSICRWSLHYIYPYCHTCGKTLSDPFSRALSNFIFYFINFLFLPMAAGSFFLIRGEVFNWSVQEAATFIIYLLFLFLVTKYLSLMVRFKEIKYPKREFSQKKIVVHYNPASPVQEVPK